MSLSGKPVKRPSRAVYRRRRLVLVVVLIVVVVVIVVLVAHAASSRGSAGAGASPSASEPAASASSSPSASLSPSPSPSPTASASGQAALCESSDVTVTPITNASSFAAGQLPQLSLSLVNHGASPCRINVGTAQQVFTILSGDGSQVYWKSTDCQSNASNSMITLEPGQPLSSGSPISWDREASDPATCDGTRAAVPAGGASYELQTSVDGIASTTSAKFTLN